MAKDRAPSFQFYPRDYMSDPDVQALTWDQRGRYHWSLCCSALSECPGRATADQWRQWMGYKAGQWDRYKAAMRNCFRVEMLGDTEVWVQERMASDRAEQRARFEQASDAGKRGADSRWGGHRSAIGDPNAIR